MTLSSSSPTTMATMTSSSTPTPSAQPPGNPSNSIATSASLYLYTFLATLVLLLTVSAAIVVRSFILRRRHRLMVEEAIRNGTWIPPTQPSRPARVDLSKKPVLWEAYIDDKGGPPGQTEQSREWDLIKPFSAAYFNKPVDLQPTLTSNSSHSLPTNTPTVDNFGNGSSTPSVRGTRSDDVPANNGTAAVDETPARPSRRRALLSRALQVLNPTPAPTSPLPAPVTAGTGGTTTGVRATEHAMAELHQRSAAPSMMRVAVLIAMPAPAQPPHPVSHDDEAPLPHIEVGVAEVLMVPNEPSTSAYASGKREVRDSVVSRESDSSAV